MFISFEGIDGSGKSTQLERLARHLQAEGREVVAVREPGGTFLGESVRQLLLDPAHEISPRAELLLFCAARAQLVDRVILPALNRGAIVLADRYVDSSTAYQFGARELTFPGETDLLHRFTTLDTWPDLTLYFHLSLDLAQMRRTGEKKDRLEQEENAFFERVAAAYENVCSDHPTRVMRMDASVNESELAERVRTAVAGLLV